jgi:hypothetical protein
MRRRAVTRARRLAAVALAALALLVLTAGPAAAADPISADNAFGKWEDFAPYPFHAYRIYYPDEVETDNFDDYVQFDTPGPNFMEKPNLTGFFAGTITSFFFSLSELTVFIGTQVLHFGYGVDIAEPLSERAFSMSLMWKREIIGPLNLEHLALMFTLLFGLIQAAKGRLSRAVIDFLIACLIFTIGLVYHDQAPETQKNMIMTSRGMSQQVLGLVLGEDGGWPPSCPPPKTPATDEIGKLLSPVNCQLWQELVRVPWEVINFGQLTAPGSPCNRQLDDLLANPQSPNRREVRKKLFDNGCQDLAKFNYNIGFERPVFAMMTLFASFILTIVFILIASTLLISQFTTVGLFAIASVAFFLGLLPALARMAFWRWLSATAVSLSLVFVQSAILALGLWLLVGAMSMATGLNLFTRFLLLDIIAVTILFYRRRLTRAIGEQINATGKHVGLVSAGEAPVPAHQRTWPTVNRIGVAPVAAEAAQEMLIGRRHHQLRTQLKHGFHSLTGEHHVHVAVAVHAPNSGNGGDGGSKKGNSLWRGSKWVVRKGKNPAIALGLGTMAIAGTLPIIGVLPVAVPALASAAMGLGVIAAARGTTRGVGRTTRNAWKKWQGAPGP